MTSRTTLGLLKAYESRNVTFIEPDGSWPIVWSRARGVHVWDEKGKRYVDLTGAFGVAAAGHANPRVVAAARRQMGDLLHAMGDVHPHRLKAELAKALSGLTFERWTGAKAQRGNAAIRGKTTFCNSGFEAVEAALKTALLASGRPGVIAFKGGYHGLGYGALNATHRAHFRSPFRTQLREFGRFVPFPCCSSTSVESSDGSIQAQGSFPSLTVVEAQIRRHARTKKFGAILVEPIQVRGGINIPPPEFLPLLRRLCDEYEMALILDEIYTGFGRTGKWFACEHSGVIPDLVCVGKALTGGFPLSACIGRADLMDAAWPPSSGEAIHTSTFLGHPVGCAMALANIGEIRRRHLVEHGADQGVFLSHRLSRLAGLSARQSAVRFKSRGVGLLAGLELSLADGSAATQLTLEVIKRLLHLGFILLPEGEHANVISFTPPLIISKAQLEAALVRLEKVLLEKLGQ
jgi:4-aminobutyrate aminotransferase-like enzyme